MSTNPQPEYRVSSTDPAILREVAEGLCTHFHIKPDDMDREEALQVLVTVLGDSPDGDGYQLAKTLDQQYGWEMHEEDVEALASAHFRTRSIAHKKSLQKIKELGVTPRFSVGDTVSWKRAWKQTVTGVIKSVLPTEMSYHIPVEENGKLIEYIIRDEDLTKVPA